ncbi:YqgE/AlgH family protein [Roseovarius sp. SCSIO 43702]|uniref:YqgE/AlgH family protein n=1 Tax=Roseovarius sp. SCSIO 43702 TaxID=2823043 RepID=UPI001C72B7A1|nr:YqgE/AlgH family protein [Roseovarius sp. SCSIO 43702]QYX57468.1 YqgE/AlgH family protein [Roseovarius sp. SCSIO 43702]
MSADTDLTGKLLIAMPGMGDERFAHSVVLICAYSAEGAMGIIVNKVTEDLRLGDLLEQLSIETNVLSRDVPVYFGGPVEHGRGFVLHDRGYASSIASMEFAPDFAMTATLDILEDMARGGGPEDVILALGYAGWGPGQLEAEIAQNGWLVCDATPELVFRTGDARKWEAALTALGISPLMLSSEGGRA